MFHNKNDTSETPGSHDEEYEPHAEADGDCCGGVGDAEEVVHGDIHDVQPLEVIGVLGAGGAGGHPGRCMVCSDFLLTDRHLTCQGENVLLVLRT